MTRPATNPSAPVVDEPLPTADQIRLLGLPVWIWLLGLLVLHLGFCAARFAPAITCADANGYWAQGTRLAQTGRTWFRPESDIQYIGAHWLVTEDGRYFARYPAGLPVLVAAVTKLFGYRFSVWINPVLSILALVGVYQLTRRLAGPRWALLAPLFLALNPIYSRHALQNDSHMAIVCLLAWGLALLLAWSESGSLWRLFLGSVLLGAIPAVRYPEALYALGIGVFLIWRSLGKPRPYLHCLVGLGGALLPLVPLMIHNHYAFGAFWNTAYSLTNEQTGFGWNYFTQHAMQYLSNLQGSGLGILFALGLGASAAMCAYPKRRAEGAMFLLLIVPSTLLYMAYYWAPRMMTAGTMRFLLPTFVCYAAAAAWGLSRVAPHLPRSAVATGTAVLVCIYGVWGGVQSVQDTFRDAIQRRALAMVTDALERQVEPGAVVLAQPQLLQHLDFVGTWKLAEPSQLGRRPTMRRGLRGRDTNPDSPSPMQQEKRRLQEERYAGMSPFARQLEMARELRGWADGKDIYLVGEPEEAERFQQSMLGGYKYEEVARIPIPEEWRKEAGLERDGAGVRPGPDAGPMGREGMRGGEPGFAGEAGGMPRGAGPGMPGGFGGVPRLAGGRFPDRGGMAGGGMGRQPGQAGGMPQRRAYLLSCEELVVLRITPRS